MNISFRIKNPFCMFGSRKIIKLLENFNTFGQFYVKQRKDKNEE